MSDKTNKLDEKIAAIKHDQAKLDRGIILAQAAKAAVDERAHQVELAAGLPDLLIHKGAANGQLARLVTKKARAHQAELEATSERARAILETAAGETATWRADLVALCVTSVNVGGGSGAVQGFYSQLDSHIATLPAIQAALLEVQAELRALAGTDFARLWADVGGNDPRFDLQFKPGEIQTAHRKRVYRMIKDLARQGKVYRPGPSR